MDRTVRLVAWALGWLAVGYALQEALPPHRLAELIASAWPF